jgi:GrpB-like predicted nucleotidyltransferase (UPF0157 family)
MELKAAELFIERAEKIHQNIKANILPSITYERFEHIGSTAVPGALTKGDIDFYLEVLPGNHNSTVAVLLANGFELGKNTLRNEELCMVVHSSCSVQVVSKGSKYDFFVTFRDALNGNEELVARYNKIKQESVGLEKREYQDKKSIFIEAVLKSL